MYIQDGEEFYSETGGCSTCIFINTANCMPLINSVADLAYVDTRGAYGRFDPSAESFITRCENYSPSLEF